MITIGIFMGLMLVGTNNHMKVVKYEVKTSKINQAIKLVLITDFHGCDYGKNQNEIMEKLDQEKPDLVLLGGDIFDDRLSHKHSKELIKILSEKYDCYYVSGNHDVWSGELKEIKNFLKAHEVKVLEGEMLSLSIGGDTINLCGLDDPSYYQKEKDVNTFENTLLMLDSLNKKQNYTILLSHRPEYVETYKKYDFDLILAGHAHGGQWRIPGILNGLLAPNQGLFPKYAGGRYSFYNKEMIVSRGLARESTRVPRIFNRPELVIIQLKP